MSTKSVCDMSCGAIHEFALVLDKAGFNADLVQNIVNSRGNEYAKAMYESIINRVKNKTWRKEDSIIYFSVTSDGTTGEDWIKRRGGNGFRVGDYAKQVLRSPDFKPTNGVTTEIAVLKGILFEDNDRSTKKIRAEADKRKLEKPNAELVCLIREKFTDKDIEAMELWYIVAMHEPINDFDGDPYLLYAYRLDGGRWLHACIGRPDSRWDRDGGFAFAVSQVSSQH